MARKAKQEEGTPSLAVMLAQALAQATPAERAAAFAASGVKVVEKQVIKPGFRRVEDWEDDNGKQHVMFAVIGDHPPVRRGQGFWITLLPVVDEIKASRAMIESAKAGDRNSPGLKRASDEKQSRRYARRG